MQFDRRLTIFALFAAPLAGCGLTLGPQPLEPGTQIILVRHADREGDDLSAEGVARAAALPAAIADLPLDAIYSSEPQRNLDSAAPLSEARGLDTQVIQRADITGQILEIGQGNAIIWIGNSDNLREIWDEVLRLPRGDAPLTYGDIAIVEAGFGGVPEISRRRVEP